MSRASSWNTLEVVRPQPGQAATSGTKVKAHRLQQLLRGLDLERAVPARLRRQRKADGVPDSVLQEDADRSRGGDDPLRAHAGFGQPEVQRIVGAAGELAVD